MARLLAAAAALLMLVVALPAAPADPLEAHRWRDRLLLVFVPDNASTEVRETVAAALNRRADGMAERHLVTLWVGDNEARYGRNVSSSEGRRIVPGSAPSAAALRARFAPPPDRLCVVLVGKDGGEKARQCDGIALEKLFEQIDGMPMRRQEMRQQEQERQ